MGDPTLQQEQNDNQRCIKVAVKEINLITYSEGQTPHIIACDNMTSKIVISVLLLVAIFIPFLTVPNANSQTGAAYTVVTVNTPPPHQCALLPLAFSAQKGQLIQGYFTADVTVDFYILSQNDFNAFVQGNTCSLPQSAYPLFTYEQVGGSNNTYNAAIPTTGTYYILFVYRNNGFSQIASGYATIDLSYPSSITLTTSTNSSMMSVTTATPEFPIFSLAIPLTLCLSVVAVTIRRERKLFG
ncbi:MAG: hypothetical protein ABSA92_07600 [Candidatus Bathyarchaeia archaeon]|jgi:hypothetical protein